VIEAYAAQLVGLIGFGVGATTFLQGCDRSFRQRLTLACYLIGIHFWLLGLPAAATSTLLSGTRSWVSGKTRSTWVMLLFMALTLGIGQQVMHSPAEWLAICGSCLSTFALFKLQGVAMRLLILAGTLCWLANNLVAGSVGGILLESTYLAANLLTIYRLRQATRTPSSLLIPRPALVTRR